MFSRGKRDKARPAIILGCGIQDFFVMRGVLFVRGVVERRLEKKPPLISVRLGDGSLHPVRLDEDPFVPTVAAHWSFSVSHILPPKTPTDAIGRISVVFDFPDGRFEMTDLTSAGHARDEFLNSEKGFWDAVRANPTANVLEIGSRARSGVSRRNFFPETCNYVGLDIMAGENVSVVGDAHELSSLFPAEHFDFVFSVSVWEHLAMPWKVSIELNRVMKTGGLAMINTHQSWPVHEEPWDYFRFSDFAWDTLFNAATGFEIVARGMGTQCVMAPSLFNPPFHDCRIEWHYGCLSTRAVVRKVGGTALSWPVDPASVTRGRYSH